MFPNKKQSYWELWEAIVIFIGQAMAWLAGVVPTACFQKRTAAPSKIDTYNIVESQNVVGTIIVSL